MISILKFLPFLIIFLASLYNSADLDLGWHLKYGQYFLQHGQVLRDNIFSSSMPDFHYINTSWLSDVLEYFTYQHFGFWGITFLGAIVVMLTFFFFSEAAMLTLWEQALIFPVLFYLEEPVNSASFRPQLWSLLFLGILFYILSRYREKPRLIFLTIPLFWLWVQLHGAYLSGLIMFGLWVVLNVIPLKKGIQLTKLDSKMDPRIREDDKNKRLKLFLILIACAAVMLVNPFGLGVYAESFKHFGNIAQKYIIEWTPLDPYSNLWWNHIGVGIGVLASTALLYFRHPGKRGTSASRISNRFWTSQNDNFLTLLVIFLAVFFLPFWMRRYAWMVYYLAMPLLIPLVKPLQPNDKAFRDLLAGSIFLIYFVMVLYPRISVQHFETMNWSRYCLEYMDCSPKAGEFLSKNYPGEKLFSFYNWGGWLIWNYPEIKPNMDGRMGLWRDEKGYSGFLDYFAYDQNKSDIDKSSYGVVFTSPRRPIYYRMKDLEKEGKWKTVYEDEKAGVFERNK